MPKTWTLQNYRDVLANEDFQRALLNSAGIAAIATVLAIIFATLTAYAIARLEFRGKTDRFRRAFNQPYGVRLRTS